MVPLNALLVMGVTPVAARSVLLALNVACDKFEINTKERICGFIAQCAHESRKFTTFREDMFYRDAQRIADIFSGTFNHDAKAAAPYVGQPQKLANKVYANKHGNGDEASGDGWKYRGRGPIQITFQVNYQGAEQACDRPYASQPDLLLAPDDGCLASAWYWKSRGCNELMDSNDFASTTRKINAAMAGAKERQALYDLAVQGYH